MSIRYKLLSVMSVVLALTGAFGFFAVRALTHTGDLVVRMYDEPLMAINHARSAQTSLSDARALMQRALMLRDDASHVISEKIGVLVTQAVEDLKIVRERIAQEDAKAAVKRAEVALRHWADLSSKVMSPPTSGLTELPLPYTISKQGDVAASAIDELVELAASYGYEFRQSAKDSVRHSNEMFIGLSGAIIVVGFILSVMFSHSLSRPIRTAMDVAERVASGDFTDHIRSTRKDELGRLLISLASMQASLKMRVDGEAASREQAERVRLEQEAARRSMTVQLASMFEAKVGTLVSSFEGAAARMEALARAMAATAVKSNHDALAVSGSAETTAHNVTTMASATEKLAASASEIGTLVMSAGQTVSHAVEATRRTDGMVGRLSQGAHKIGDIVQLISKIAGQTNLLALNATIEAARAGEAGKGFSVVASEVKSLAMQTATATSQIEAQIAEICSATSDAVEAIRAISLMIGEVSTATRAIEGAVSQQQAATAEIARNVAEASRGTEVVRSSINEVRGAVVNTSNVAEQVLDSAVSLAHGAQELNVELNEFLEGVRAA